MGCIDLDIIGSRSHVCCLEDQVSLPVSRGLCRLTIIQGRLPQVPSLLPAFIQAIPHCFQKALRGSRTLAKNARETALIIE